MNHNPIVIEVGEQARILSAPEPISITVPRRHVAATIKTMPGPQGLQGEQGLQGPQGDQGPEGPVGPEGSVPKYLVVDPGSTGAEINAALAIARTEGRILFLPAGTYPIETTILAEPADQIEGAGQGRTLLDHVGPLASSGRVFPDPAAPMATPTIGTDFSPVIRFEGTDQSGNFLGGRISNLTVRCPGIEERDGIELKNAHRVAIRDVTIDGVNATLSPAYGLVVRGEAPNGSEWCKFANVKSNRFRVGVAFDGGGSANRWSNRHYGDFWAQSCGIGTYFAWSSTSTYSQIAVQGCDTGMYLDQGTRWNWINFIEENSTTWSIPATSVDVTGNTLMGTWDTSKQGADIRPNVYFSSDRLKGPGQANAAVRIQGFGPANPFGAGFTATGPTGLRDLDTISTVEDVILYLREITRELQDHGSLPPPP